jgi:hypothetical protein
MNASADPEHAEQVPFSFFFWRFIMMSHNAAQIILFIGLI